VLWYRSADGDISARACYQISPRSFESCSKSRMAVRCAEEPAGGSERCWKRKCDRHRRTGCSEGIADTIVQSFRLDAPGFIATVYRIRIRRERATHHPPRENQMSQTASSSKQHKYDAGVARAEGKLEVALIPVSDVDRAKQFYTTLGWRLDDRRRRNGAVSRGWVQNMTADSPGASLGDVEVKLSAALTACRFASEKTRADRVQPGGAREKFWT
jgi:hypothetical protein